MVAGGSRLCGRRELGLMAHAPATSLVGRSRTFGGPAAIESMR